MATTRKEISKWFDAKKKEGCTHMIIVCDTFDWQDFPVGVSVKQKVEKVYKDISKADMQKVMEVYDLNQDKERQLNQERTFNF